MLLRRLTVTDYRRFRHFEAAFAPGVNVIVGGNEAGKSTLREAITMALFQDPRTADRKVLAQRSWGSARQFCIELRFDAEGKSFLLRKDFQTKSNRLMENPSETPASGTGAVLEDPKAVEARVKALLGLPSRAAFESTVRVSQRDITRLQNSKEIADRLQELVTGGEQDVQASRVLAELDHALLALRSGARSRPGHLVSLPAVIAQKETMVAGLRQKLAKASFAASRLALVEEALDEARAGLERQRAMEKACAARLRLEDELSRVRAATEALEEALEETERLEKSAVQAEAELAGFEAVMAVSQSQISEIAALEARARDGGWPDGEAVASGPVSRPRQKVIGAGLILVLAGAVGLLAHEAALLLAVAGMAIVLWEFVHSRQLRAARLLAKEMRAQDRVVATDAARLSLAEILSNVGCGSVGELHFRRKTAEDLQGQIRDTRARLAGLLRGKTVATLEAERREAARRLRGIQENLDEPAMRLAKIDNAGYQLLLAASDQKAREVDALLREVEELRVMLRVNEMGEDEIHALEEEAEELRDRLTAAEDRYATLTVTRQVLEEARAATMVSAKKVLEKELGGLVGEITLGRYNDVRVDASELTIELIAPERKEPVSVALEGELSTGTVEQVYLAARVALAKLLSHGCHPPLVLDDPFVSFDPHRLAAVMQLCKRISREHQVLLLTCHNGYEEVADNVIILPPVESII